ncbi:MAG: thiamine pyrophosphate-dependent enzyme, partial [Pseudomonadota bacterium]|nr:thiamine pyrophosphate-dependent enzyme [Pseudomonadota bacterium]
PNVDIVLAVGTRFLEPYMFWGTDTALKIIRIDVDPKQIVKPKVPDIGLVTSSKLGLEMLANRITKYNRKRDSRENDLGQIRKKVEQKLSRLTIQKEYSDVLRASLPENGILVPDVTQLMFYTWFGYPVYLPRTLLFPGYQDSLGYGFATAMGVKVANPDVRVLCISGDGGFMLTMPELATAVRHGINLVTVVFNDGAFGNVKRIQKERFDGNFLGSDLNNPDFVELAKLFGAVGLRAETPIKLQKALEVAFDADGPVIVEVPVSEMPGWQQIMPRSHIRGSII